MKTPRLPGPVVRVTLGLLTAAACFQVGRWTGRLEAQAAPVVRADPGNEMILSAHPVAPSKTVEPPAPSASGDPVGQNSDIITPLNVRDPSALVMGPGASACPPSFGGVDAPPPPTPRASGPRRKLKTEPLPEGRLLELLKKDKSKPDEPKVY